MHISGVLVVGDCMCSCMYGEISLCILYSDFGFLLLTFSLCTDIYFSFVTIFSFVTLFFICHYLGDCSGVTLFSVFLLWVFGCSALQVFFAPLDFFGYPAWMRRFFALFCCLGLFSFLSFVYLSVIWLVSITTVAIRYSLMPP
ncbi:hypothetical protein FPQ18DRAFT_104553 [Pyronema domesticum]|nr:hypothetical protein FPQ18DRAFT_104553 [Pyronema domesticum]